VVIGSGLVGASVGCALTEAGVEVHLEDLVPAHVQVAASRRAGSAAPVDPQLVRLVVVAVPPDELAEVIGAALGRFPKATVTDVGSVKGTVLAKLRTFGIELDRYVGSHPMAGSHQAGPLGARADLFNERTWIVTPHDTAAAHAVLDVNQMVRLCRGRLVTMGAAHHDEAVAQVSHLPQLVSALMAGSLQDLPVEHLRLAGQGLRDVTRIAGGDPELWEQIIRANQTAVQRELRKLVQSLDALLASFEQPGALIGFLARGQSGRQSLPGKHGTAATSFAHVIVEIPDTPGALARLFRDIEAAGVNVEDLSIDHDLDREVGFLSVQVAPDRADGLAEAMKQAGWTLRDPDPET
jgi:prephenate dehydrogenase